MQGISEKAALPSLSGAIPSDAPANQRCLRALLVVLIGLVGCFAKPLFDLLLLSFREEIHSHIILIPLISIYLIRQRRTQWPKAQTESVIPVIGAAVVPLGILAASFAINSIPAPELLSIRILCFWMFLLIAVFATLGREFFRALLFPLCFLFFLVPLPPSIIDPLETASKIASTEVFTWMMDITQSTYFRQGFIFALPGLSIQVAQECSGIRSSLVLFIVSMLAANMFLTTTWKRIFFCFFVIPLGVVRNAFRIFTLATLSVHWDRSVIDSPLHHKGGPLFFALSLIPFFLVLLWLRKSELHTESSSPSATVRK